MAGDWAGVAVGVCAGVALAVLSAVAARRFAVLESAARDGHDVTSRVLRDGATVVVSARDLAVGDLLAVEPGDVLPAAARCLEGDGLLVDDVCTAESGDAPTAAAWRASSGDMLAPLTVVRAGRGVVEVVAPTPARAAADAHGWTRDVDRLGRGLLVACAGLAVVAAVVEAVSGSPWRSVVAIFAAVLAAAPVTSLAATLVAVVRSGSLRRLSGRGVRLDAATLERSGSLTLLVTDKAGTLTDEGTSVAQAWTADGDLGELARSLALGLADPPAATDVALLGWATSMGVDATAIRAAMPRVAEVPYDAGRRRMTTASDTGDGFLVVSRGAPEAVWPMLVTSSDGASTATAVAQPLARSWAVDGLRVIAVASTTRRVAGNAAGRLEWGLRLVGLVGLSDPPMSGAREAIADLAELGVGVALATGDHRATAVATASNVGILQGSTRGAGVVTGEGLDEGQWAHDVRVFARIGPEQRAALVVRWREADEIVAVIGQGRDDIEAMRRADIGVSVGRRPVEAVRHAAPLHIEAPHLDGVVWAVRESRRSGQALRRGLGVLVVAGLGCAVVAAAGSVFGAGPGMSAAQVLVVTLVVAGLPVLAYAREPLPAGGGRPPTDSRAGLFPPRWWQVVALRVLGLLAVVGIVAAWAWGTDQALPATVFVATAGAVLGLAAAGRSLGATGRAATWVTAWLVVAGALLVAGLLPPLSWFIGATLVGASGFAIGGVVAAVVAGLAGYALGRVSSSR